jgi:uncharacterized protein (DUF488 family)
MGFVGHNRNPCSADGQQPRSGDAGRRNEVWARRCGYPGVMGPSLLTVGHGTATQEELTELLRAAGVDELVDVRRYPGSRAHPHVSREALAKWLPSARIGYRWEERLGGRRRLPAESPDRWWRVDAFRAYAHHMRSAEFLDAVDDLLVAAATARTVVMCGESLWWRCHRRLIADFVTLARATPVHHLYHDGQLLDHPIAAGARRAAGGVLVYDLD